MSNKFLSESDETPLHSSVFAEGDTMGATSVQSFSERNRIERSREVIQSYGHSLVARGIDSGVHRRTSNDIRGPYASEARRPALRPRFNATGDAAPSTGSRPQQSAPRFVEPPVRGFNPYQ